ncbi:MAG TPA: hypothetical protein VGM10_25005 [Actinocrinis sp.]|jgi:hypothetical protein
MSGARPAAGVNLYPWDVVGDPACAERVAGLGADRVALAATYHTVRALTPRHPEHKVVTAAYSAVYYETDPRRWQGRRLQPVEAYWSQRSFTEAAPRLRAAGLSVYAWTVLAHNQRLGSIEPECSVANAYGDRFPWALCISQPAVCQYCATLVAEVAQQPHIDGIELEACGWYGFNHLHAHDKTGGVAFDGAAELLLSLCFCEACLGAYRGHEIDPAQLRGEVRKALDAVMAGETGPATALDPELAARVARMRVAAADRMRGEAIAAVRAQRPDLPVLVHTHPDPLAMGANAGTVLETLYGEGGADGAILACGVRSAAALANVRQCAALAGPGPAGAAQAVAATVSAVRGLGGRPDDLPAWCADLRDAGASELRFYHAGIASDADLAAVREAIATYRAPESRAP